MEGGEGRGSHWGSDETLTPAKAAAGPYGTFLLQRAGGFSPAEILFHAGLGAILPGGGQGSDDLHATPPVSASAKALEGHFMSSSVFGSQEAFALLQTISDTHIYLKKEKKEREKLFYFIAKLSTLNTLFITVSA